VFVLHTNSEAVLAEMGVALKDDSSLVGVFSPKKVSNKKRALKPKFHYANFHRKFLVVKVVDTNHDSRELERWQIMKS